MFKRLFLFLFALALFVSVYADDFYFAQFTDIHYKEKAEKERAVKAVDIVNKLPVKLRFAVITGDLMNDNIDDPQAVSELKELLSKVKCDLYSLPGNHDFSISKDMTERAEIFRKNFGDLFRARDDSDVSFIFMYTTCLRKNFSFPGYDPMKMLEEKLKGAGQKPVIIFCHEPTANDFHCNELFVNWYPENREKWSKLINSANVKAVITGHFHREELHWEGNVPVYVCASIASYWKRQATVRLYHYQDGKISYNTIYIEE